MADEEPQGPRWGSQWSVFGRVTGIAFSVVILLGAGTAGGVFLDRKLGTKPLFSLVMLFLCLAGGAWYAYRSLMEMLK